MRHDSESLLETAVRAIHSDVPDATQISNSAKRVADRLGVDSSHSAAFSAIESCDDVQHLLGPYRAGTLSDASALLIRSHLRDCGECHRSYAAGPGKAVAGLVRSPDGPRSCMEPSRIPLGARSHLCCPGADVRPLSCVLAGASRRSR